MEFIKEYIRMKHKTLVIIRTNCYSSSLSHIQDVHNEFLADFPELSEIPDPNIVLYGGMHYRGTLGLEYDCDKKVVIPKIYDKRDTVELTL